MKTLEFAPCESERAEFTVFMPRDWDSDTVTIEVVWSTQSDDDDKVVWVVRP